MYRREILTLKKQDKKRTPDLPSVTSNVMKTFGRLESGNSFRKIRR